MARFIVPTISVLITKNTDLSIFLCFNHLLCNLRTQFLKIKLYTKWRTQVNKLSEIDISFHTFSFLNAFFKYLTFFRDNSFTKCNRSREFVKMSRVLVNCHSNSQNIY